MRPSTRPAAPSARRRRRGRTRRCARSTGPRQLEQPGRWPRDRRRSPYADRPRRRAPSHHGSDAVRAPRPSGGSAPRPPDDRRVTPTRSTRRVWVVQRAGRPLRRTRALLYKAPLLHARLDRFRPERWAPHHTAAGGPSRPTPAQVIVTPGAKPIMFYALLALLDEGDEAIYPDPGFPIYSSMIDFAGARGVPLPLRERNDFQPDLDELRRLVTDRTKVLVLNSPNNPTGAVLSLDAIREIARIARERDLWVLTDEIYGELVYDGEHRSIAREEGMSERTILLDGFSKTFAMTGWRLGYGAFPSPPVDPVTKLVTNSVSCTATFVQRAGAAALSTRPPEVDRMIAEFRTRRDAIVKGLSAVPGVSCRSPHGAFYVFPNIAALGLRSSTEVADRLLTEAGVATLTGTCFGGAWEGGLRPSYG